MTEKTPNREERKPRDEGSWAWSRNSMRLTNVPEGALNANVDGRRPMSPLQGFGQMWQKTYTVRLEGSEAAPKDVVTAWKQNFPKFWERGNRFYAPVTGIAPGEVMLINNPMPGGVNVSTGVMVLFADDESFTFMTPEGHPFSGWVTFSSHKDDDGTTVAQSQVLIRANDPLYEIGMPLGLHKVEDATWSHTLKNLAANFGIRDAAVSQRSVCVDPKRQWSQAKNIWYNAGIRSMLYMASLPARTILRMVAGRKRS
ncbi:MAG: hypothetical protein ACRDSJ_19355 [Rubrobacteraceae bacterium]